MHHGVGIAGGGADLQPHLPQGGRRFHRKWLGCGKLVQDGEELGLKLGIHRLHVLLPGGAAVGLLPGSGDALHPEHGADVVPLQHAHGLAGLLQGDRHAVVGEGLLKGLDRGEAAVVHGGARPVKDDGLDHAISSLWAARKPAMMAVSFSMSSG